MCQQNFFCWSEAVLILVGNEQHFMKISDICVLNISQSSTVKNIFTLVIYGVLRKTLEKIIKLHC